MMVAVTVILAAVILVVAIRTAAIRVEVIPTAARFVTRFALVTAPQFVLPTMITVGATGGKACVTGRVKHNVSRQHQLANRV